MFCWLIQKPRRKSITNNNITRLSNCWTLTCSGGVVMAKQPQVFKLDHNRLLFAHPNKCWMKNDSANICGLDLYYWYVLFIPGVCFTDGLPWPPLINNYINAKRHNNTDTTNGELWYSRLACKWLHDKQSDWLVQTASKKPTSAVN